MDLNKLDQSTFLMSQASKLSAQTAPIAHQALMRQADSAPVQSFEQTYSQAQKAQRPQDVQQTDLFRRDDELPEPPAHDVREQAQKLVTTAFLTPLFSMLRESTFAADTPFGPSSAEKSFRQQLDQLVADAMVQQLDTPTQSSFGTGFDYSVGDAADLNTKMVQADAGLSDLSSDQLHAQNRSVKQNSAFGLVDSVVKWMQGPANRHHASADISQKVDLHG